MQLFENKKILVTGGTGHLGGALIHYLVNALKVQPKNIRVFYLANSPKDSLSDLPGIEFFEGNILNSSDVALAVKDLHLVFHTVGLTTFDTRQKRQQWLVNVQGTKNVMDACLASPAFQKLCYTSTVNALGVPNPVGSIGDFENSSPYLNTPRLHSFNNPEEVLNFIGEVVTTNAAKWENKIGIGYYDSKLAAQELVNHYVKEHALNAVSVLPGTMFGPYDHLIGTGMYLLSLYRNQMPVVLKGGLPLAHVMDVAEGHTLAMEKGCVGEQYILSGKEEDNLHFKEMCSVIVDVLRQKFPHKKISKPAMVVPQWLALVAAYITEQQAVLLNQPMLLSRDAVRPGGCLSFYTSKKAATEFGYQPKYSFKQAVEHMADYFIQHNLFAQTGRWIDRR